MSAHTQAAQPITALLAPELELVLQRFRLRAQRRAMWLRRIWSAEADLLDADSPAAEA
jgi:hypothetical protein